MKLSLVTMKVLNLASGMGKCYAQNLELWIDSHWVHVVLQHWDLLMELKMASLIFWFLDALLGYLDGIEVGCNEGTELWLYSGRMLGKTLGIYDVTELGLSWCSSV